MKKNRQSVERQNQQVLRYTLVFLIYLEGELSWNHGKVLVGRAL